MEQGTYGVNHWHTYTEGEEKRNNLTRTLLARYPPHRIGLGIATTLHYKQNQSSLLEWLPTLQPFIDKVATVDAPLEVDVYYLQVRRFRVSVCCSRQSRHL